MNKLLPIITGFILAVTGFAVSASANESSNPELTTQEDVVEQAKRKKHKHKKKHKHYKKHHRHHDHYHHNHHRHHRHHHHNDGISIVVP